MNPNDMDWDYYEYGQQELEEEEKKHGRAKFDSICLYKSNTLPNDKFNHFKIAPNMEDLQSHFVQFGKDCIVTKQAGNLKMIDKQETPISQDIFKAEIPKQGTNNLIDQTTDLRNKTGSAISVYPNTAIGIVLATFKNGKIFRGTGSMCGPNHVITTAHNLISDDKSPLVKVEFFSGAMGQISIYQKTEVVRAFVLDPNSKNDVSKDLGLLILDKPLGLYSGWFGLACLTDPNIKTQKVNITGYPQDQEENNQVCQFTSQGKFEQVEKGSYLYNMEATNGQNGSPLYVEKIITETYIEHYIVGVHKGRNKEGKLNEGVRITQENLDQIRDIMEYFLLSESLEEGFYNKLLENQKIFTAEFDECDTTTKNVADLFYAIRNHLDLREVNIRVRGKNNTPSLNDQSIKELGESFKNMRRLQHLKLDLFNCDNLSSESLAALGAGICHLKDLDYFFLTISSNKKFTQNGYRDLFSNFPKLENLNSLYLSLQSLPTITDEILGQMMTHIVKTPRVTNLKLDLQMLKGIGERGVKQLAKTLEPYKRLEKINLIFMGINIPSSIKQEIKGHFKWCKGFSII